VSDLDEELLDDAEALAAADPHGVLRALAGAGAQVRRAVALAEESGIARLDPSERPRAVVVAARGGSAVVADTIAALAGAGSPVPVIARTGDVLPGWVGPLDLVVGVSLSGRSAPGVRLLAEAGRRGARVLTVGRADSAMARVSEQVRGTHVTTPGPDGAVTAPTTRTALWALLTPVLLAGDRLGLFSAGPQVLAEVADALDDEAATARPSSEAFVNPAKGLAVELAGTVPLVLGDGALASVAARRAASVLARTARVPALAGTLPDDAGDVVATFGGPLAGGDDLGPGSAHGTGGLDDLFHDPYLDGPRGPRLRLLLLTESAVAVSSPAAAAVLALAQRSGVRVSEVAAGSDDPAAQRSGLEQLARLVARTDFAATYLALGSGADPAVSPHVADLRDAMG
jgi:D-arabinose 5-phosphate isomerase GutQ